MIDKIKVNQTIVDFCMWKHGRLDELPNLILANGFNYSDIITQGTELNYVETKESTVVDYYEQNNIIPISREQNEYQLNVLILLSGGKLKLLNNNYIKLR